MKRRTFIRLAGGGIVFAAGAGGLYGWAARNVFPVPPSAIAAWRAAGREEEARRYALSYAILAPSPHNMQPWIADLGTEGEIGLVLDDERLLPQTDPYGRQTLMGCGCFMELLALAAAERGYRTEIVLFPDGEPGPVLDRRRVATIRLTAGDTPSDPLFGTVLQRRTDRRAYDPAAAIVPADIATLADAASGNGVLFGVETDPARVEAIRDIARSAWRKEVTTEGPMMENLRVLRVGSKEIGRHRDGLAVEDPLLVTAMRLGLFDRSRMPAADSAAIRSEITQFDDNAASTPAYLWVVTRDNGRAQQVESGRAYARVNLAGTGLGLSMHPNEQALQEYPEVAAEHRAIHALLAPRGGTVQMLARLGRVAAGAGRLGPSPRRPLSAFVA